MKTLNALLLFLFFSLGLNAQKFTIPVFPDPQSEVDERMDMFESQVDWIVKNREKLNMPIVLCVGDLANFDNFTHWDKASQQFEKFDKIRLPYATMIPKQWVSMMEVLHPAIPIRIYERHLNSILTFQLLGLLRKEGGLNPERATMPTILSKQATLIGLF